MMDIRVNVDFFQHPKTIKLQRRLGLGGVTALLQLWMWAAKNRPDGELRDMDEEDIEIAAGWRSDLTSDPDRDRGFAATLADLRWLDIQQKGSRTIYSLHDWAEHNPWAAETTTRSDWARLLKMADKYPELYQQYIEAGAEGISKEEYQRVVAEYKAGLTPATTETTTPPISETQRTDNETLNVPLTLSPDPDPSPDLDIKKDHELSTKLSTVLSTALSTQAKETQALEAFKALLSFPGYQVSDPAIPKEKGWIMGLIQEYQGLNVPEEMREALEWSRKKGVKIKNVKAFVLKWLKRVREERNTKSGP